nr:hypothetical protein [Chthonomonas sp.]
MTRVIRRNDVPDVDISVGAIALRNRALSVVAVGIVAIRISMLLRTFETNTLSVGLYLPARCRQPAYRVHRRLRLPYEMQAPDLKAGVVDRKYGFLLHMGTIREYLRKDTP